MSRLNLIYIDSLALLGAVLVLAVAGPIAKQGQTTPLQQVQLLEREDRWILELNLINPGDQPVEYLLRFSGPGGIYEDPVPLPPRGHLHPYPPLLPPGLPHGGGGSGGDFPGGGGRGAADLLFNGKGVGK